MNSKYKKLELCWPGKDIEVKPEPRVLIENPEKSFGEANTENMLIHADNLLALKALEQKFAGKIKCIYIDPPYNTGNAFEHYDDGLEHSIWLNLMKSRLKILWNLLQTNEGSIWISIDDREMPYLRVLMDEICGRDKFIASNVWQKRYSRENREAIGDVHEYVIVYAKSPEIFKIIRNKVKLDEKSKRVYKNLNNDPKGPWRGIPMTAQGYRPNQMYTIKSPKGKLHKPPEGRCWSTIEENFKKLLSENRIYFGKDNNSQPNIIRYLSEVEGHVPWTWWPHDDVGHTDEAKKEQQILFGKENTFDTSKPERLIERVLNIATNPGDFILDSFLGSGTTVAVAHKMNRKWIGIELGEHCNTHCLPRLKAVCDGTDQGGISKAVEWKGGGGFKFYELAPSLLNKDKYNQWVINPNYNAQLLAAAMARHEGFTYCPSESVVWKQGNATENHFIFTTTNTITPDVVEQILSELKPGESLRICCTAFIEGCNDISPRIEIKKIPAVLLGKCEFGKEDYCTDNSIINMPADRDKPSFTPSYVKPEVKPSPAKISKSQPTQTNLLF